MKLQILLLLAVLTQAACRAPARTDNASADPSQPNDPAEGTNRWIFGVNMAIDRNVAKPVAAAYEDNVPHPVRDSVHNFAANLGEPKVLINDVLEGNLRRAANTTGRFVLNSTVGVAGLFDVADKVGMPYHEADFGETFGVWGVGPGPSVQLPLMGSSNVRDSVGMVVGIVANPLSAVPGTAMTVISAAGAGGGVIDGRAQTLDASNTLEKTSLDYYATLRSVSEQRRAAQVADGRAGLVGD